MMRQHHVNKAQQIQANGFPADNRCVVPNDAPLLEPAQALLQARP
jgi:hypothetical protein